MSTSSMEIGGADEPSSAKRDARPDTGVDDTDHDTLSGYTRVPPPPPSVKPRSRVMFVKLTQLIRDDGDDVLLCRSFSAIAG